MHDEAVAHEFQYASASHQADTAVAGMWLFLATEVVFFGALFLSWIFARHFNQAGFDAGAERSELEIGTINTVILITGSLVYSLGVVLIEKGKTRAFIMCAAAAWLLGLAFMILKFAIEWRHDLDRHMFPGADFGITGDLAGGAKLFWSFYFFGTFVHGVHLAVGLGLVAWVILRVWQGAFSAAYLAPVLVVGLYWTFVDIVWLILYPLIYLIGRAT
ncbi:MAG: cytochrome c oxidase subunit 3 [Methylocapsa sp.]|nr:cytochrome c oxidase subunit 3 [Methylocapsa sp.]